MKICRATNPRTAFTLIEMVVALVLASLMMVGLLRIVSLVARETDQLRGEQTDYLAIGMLSDRMRKDLINARGIVATSSAIALAGYVSDPNRPGVIRYERAVIDNRPVLVRIVGNRSEICWVGFSGFLYESFEVIDAETPISEVAGGLPPVPSLFRIGVVDADGRVLINEVVHHHAE